MFGSYADELSEQENKLLQAQAISALSPFERARFKPAYKPVEKPRSEISQLIIDNLADPYKVRWRNVTDDQKLALSFIETEARGGYSFRLTFSRERAKRLLAVTDPCQTFSRDFLDRELKKEFHETLPYSFRFEFSNKGVLHIHGAIIADQQLNNIEARLRMVLNKAGGVTGLSSQSKVIRLYDALGYFSYLEKSTTATVKKMPSNKHDITRVNDKIRNIINNNHEMYRNTK